MAENGVPESGALNIVRGVPYGKQSVDYLMSRPDQRIWYRLWSRKTVAAAATTGTTSFYADVSATKFDGNVVRAGSLPTPHIFIVFSVTLGTDALAAVADTRDFADNAVLTITINDRKELGPDLFRFFPEGAGVAAADTTSGSNGVADSRARDVLRIPLVIKGGEEFKVEMDYDFSTVALSDDVRVTCAMHGLDFRRSTSQ